MKKMQNKAEAAPAKAGSISPMIHLGDCLAKAHKATDEWVKRENDKFAAQADTGTAQVAKRFKVETITGYAGGHGEQSPAVVTLKVSTTSNTVEQVREFVEIACNAYAELLEALKACLHYAETPGDFSQKEAFEMMGDCGALIERAERGQA